MERILEDRNKEIVSYVPIDTLNVLVHPLHENFGTDIIANNFTRGVRRNLFNDVIHEYIPQSPKDILVIVPDVEETLADLRRKVLEAEIEMQLFDDPYSWVTIYKYSREHAISPKNVLLGKNVPEMDIPSTEIEAQLKGRGFGIMSDTKIIVGGELVEGCIIDTVTDFLSLPQVPYVLIDRKISLGISEYRKHGDIPETSDQACATRLNILGYNVAPEGNRYLKVVRP